MCCFPTSIYSIFDDIYESDESLLLTDTKLEADSTTSVQSTSPTPPETHPQSQLKPGATGSDVPLPKGWREASCEMPAATLAGMVGDRNMPVHDIITETDGLEFIFLYGENDFYSVNIVSGDVYKILEPRGKKELWDVLEKDYYGVKASLCT